MVCGRLVGANSSRSVKKRDCKNKPHKGLFLWYNIGVGALAQLIERGIRIAEVAGLIPARSTKNEKPKIYFRVFIF